MKYRPLADTGVFVSELCLGAMTFGSQWEMIGALDQKDADTLVNRSLDEGINFFVQDRVHIKSYLHDASNHIRSED